ncbi:MAG: hypothetical protein ACRDH7_15070 [Actinomycetota bacterium]
MAGARKRTGRPDGSVRLTPEIQNTIVSYILAGAWDYVAAEAAGIDARTFRDWMARGEGRHPTRSATPELVEFARAVREAKARSRAKREIEVAEHRPEFWLTHQGRSRPGREGWTDPVPDEEATGVAPISFEPTMDDATQTLRILIDAGAIELPGCADPNCSCRLHRGREDA